MRREAADVVIIGGGPAGSTLASLLARRGVGAALVERDTFPRDKLCGEFLSYDALPLLQRMGLSEALASRGVPQIVACRIVSRTRTYEFEFPAAARGASRLFLDDLLFRRAVASGAADWSGWTATAIDPQSPRVSVRRDSEEAELNCRIIIGAWGRWGRFDAQLGRAFVRERSHRSFGFKRHYRGPTQPVIELYSFQRGYLGVSPVEDGITNICGLVDAARLEQHKGRWQSFVEMLRSEEPRLEALYARYEPAQEDFLSSEPVIFRGRAAVERGIIMIGDASGIVDPLTGNGQAMAIQSATLAAPHILSLLGVSGDRGPLFASYMDAHRQFFSPRIRWSREIARLLSRPAMLDAALAFAGSPRLGTLLLKRTRAAADAVERIADRWFC